MKNNGSWITAAALAGCLCLATAALADEPAKPAAAPQGEALLFSITTLFCAAFPTNAMTATAGACSSATPAQARQFDSIHLSEKEAS